MKLSKFLPLACLIIYILAAFKPFFLNRLLPIPADTIVGLYHPWRDVFSGQYPNGIPFKNPLITDPVRQQYPWRELAIEKLKKGEWPIWNPYSGLGKPLLANLQTAAFYPLNFIFWLLPFSWGWSLQVLLQPLLGGLFMWLYLKSLKLRPEACALGMLAWVGSGFFVAWLEWNTLVQTAIWLPLILLAIDRNWPLLLVLSLSSSLLAGHPQIFFYILIMTVAYAAFNRKISLTFFLSMMAVFLITSFQWIPMINLFKDGVRSVGPNDYLTAGWFLPVSHLAQFIAPDFFGNPATGNYFGIWNYGEFIGYIGIVPLVFALNKKHLLWLSVLILSLLFALSNPVSQIIPQVVQPTRLMVLIDFSLAMLAALGLDQFLKTGSRISRPVGLIILFLVGLWLLTLNLNLLVSQRNLVLPTVLAVTAAMLLWLYRKHPRLAMYGLLALTIFDLARFSLKFESFSSSAWLYPETKITGFLSEKSQGEDFRVMALDDRIFPPNFSTHYKIKMISDYDSFYLADEIKNLGGPSRILTPKDISPSALKLFNVKYLLTFDFLDPARFKLVLQEGETKIYEVIDNNSGL